jgi:hypothetical protein
VKRREQGLEQGDKLGGSWFLLSLSLSFLSSFVSLFLVELGFKLRTAIPFVLGYFSDRFWLFASGSLQTSTLLPKSSLVAEITGPHHHIRLVLLR